MKTNDSTAPTAVCANPGCGTPSATESDYCESCELERMLFRRDLRPAALPRRDSRS